MAKPLLFVCACALSFSATAEANNLEACRAKLKQAQKLEVLYDMKWQGPALYVAAGPTYYKMPFDAKEGFADTVNCFAMAGKAGCLSFDITHWMTGRPTDRYHMCKLSPK
jgi:hypothetical protein